MKKIVTLQLAVRVDASVSDNEVAQQIGDALDPDSWNWDVSYPDVISSGPAPEDDDDDDPDEDGDPHSRYADEPPVPLTERDPALAEAVTEPDSEDDPGRETKWARNATVIRRFLDNPGPPLTS